MIGFKREKAHSVKSFERAYVTELASASRVKTELVPVVNDKDEEDQVLLLWSLFERHRAQEKERNPCQFRFLILQCTKETSRSEQ